MQNEPRFITRGRKNSALVIGKKEVHQTPGGQPTATAARSNLAAIGRGAGIEQAMEVRTEAELRAAYDRILREDGPFVVSVKIAIGRTEGRLDRDVVGYTRRFVQALAAR